MSKTWNFLGGLSADISSDSTIIISGSTTVLQSATVLRVRGQGFVALQAACAADDQADVVFGLGIFSADAVVAGSGSLPDPAGDPEYPWLWWKSIQMYFPFVIDGTGSDDSGQIIHRFEIDTKAMRRMKVRESIVMVAQYADVSGAPPLRVSTGRCRVLRGEEDETAGFRLGTVR